MSYPFKELKHSLFPGSIRRLYEFDNGYGASVICNERSYGGKSGLFELAVLERKATGVGDDNWQICTTTPITPDVLGYLTEADVQKLLFRISALRRNDNHLLKEKS